MSGPIYKSPIKGLPDGVVMLPKKPIRLTLEPQQAVMLHVALTIYIEGLHAGKPGSKQAQVLSVFEEVLDLLDDRLEVSFHA